jgi:hypothetical protein
MRAKALYVRLISLTGTFGKVLHGLHHSGRIPRFFQIFCCEIAVFKDVV